MAFMTKMRDAMPVIFAVLAGVFILSIFLGDWGAKGTLFGHSTGPDGKTIAVVNGMPVPKDNWDAIYQDLVNQEKRRTGKSDFSEAEEAELREQAWDQLLTQSVVRANMAKLGVTVSDEEVRDLVYGENPPAFLKQQFTDSLGVFNRDAYVQALRDPRNAQQIASLDSMLREQIKQSKWQNLVTASIRVTDGDLWERYENTNAKTEILVARIQPPKPAQEFVDQVSDQEARKYYDEHQYLYKREDARAIRFVVFNQQATPKDSAMARDKMQKLRERLAAAPDDMADTVAKEIAEDYGDGNYAPSHELATAEMGQVDLTNAKRGDVFITEGQQQAGQMLIRITNVVDSGAEFYHPRHILIGFGTNNNRDSAKALSEQIIAQIRSGQIGFADAAAKYSIDPGSARRGGDLGWVGPKQFVPEFESAVLKSKPGELVGPVPSNYGMHIIEVLGKTRRKVAALSVPIPLKASSETARQVAQQAQVFRERAVKDGFDQAAKVLGYQIITDAPPVQKKAQPIFGSRRFVDWTFTADKGDISQAFKIPQAHITVVAQVTEIMLGGIRPFDDVKAQIKSDLAKGKRLDSYADYVKQLHAKIGPDGDIAKLKEIDQMVKIDTANLGPAESVAQLGGTEYAVNNMAFGKLKVGEVSQPIKGDNAWFIIKPTGRTPATKEQMQAEKQSLLQNLLREKQERFFRTWLEKEKESAEITDYRSIFDL